MLKLTNFLIIVALLTGSVLSGCASQRSSTPAGIPVVATTSILADVVSRVGGDLVTVTTLVPLSSDEHEYQPAPRDIAAVADAALVFEVGLGLEQFMSTIIQNAGTKVTPVMVSEGIEAKSFGGAENSASSVDPHVWLDPANVMIWAQNIEAAMAKYDPAHADIYASNAKTYTAELQSLDDWIRSETGRIPADKRLLVTDHMMFGYFAVKYDFKVIGAVIPSYSSAAQPSAQELAALEDAIRSYRVPVILVGNSVNPALAEQVANDTGVRLVRIYTGSLSAPAGPAGSYLDYMRFDVQAIIDSLSG